METNPPLPDSIPEPCPAVANQICCICMGEFDNYFQHIDSISHKDRAKLHQDIYQIIDEESCDMNFDFESEAH